MENTKYDQWAIAQEKDFEWYSQRMFKDQINAWNPILEFFKSELDQQGKIVVEIGCGPTGGILKFMKAQLLIGIEPLSNQFLQKGFENIVNPKILFLNSFGEDIPLVNGFADMVCCIHSLGHVQKPKIVLKEADRILKEGGKLLLLEILREPTQITEEHPIALKTEDFARWLEKNQYSHIRMDATQTLQENEEHLSLFYGIFRKEIQPCKLSSTIDFSIESYEEQIGGGWFSLETESLPMRWVSNEFSAYLSLKKDHKILLIEGYVTTEHFSNKNLRVSFEVNGVHLGEQEFHDDCPFCLKFPLPKNPTIGKTKVKGYSSECFVPDQKTGSGDDRELSFIIFRLGFYP